MAERRMFAKTIIHSDAFTDMPFSAQALYFQLATRADDDGFVNNPKQIQRMIGASADDLELLTSKRFILSFDSGVVVIKHWKIHNYIRSDRYKPTIYEKEKNMLRVKENGSYTDDITKGIPLGIPNDNQMDTQDRKEEGEDKEGEDISLTHSAREEGDNVENLTDADKERLRLKLLGGTLGGGVVMLSDEQFSSLCDELSHDELNKYIGIVRDCELKGKSYKNKTHYQAILDMAKKDRKIK